MRYATFISIAIVSGLLLSFKAHSQNVRDSAKNEISFGINYQSHLHYFGRVDSLKSSGVFPVIGLKSSTGLYLNSSFIFIGNASQSLSYTGTILEGGYRFPYSKNFSGNIYYDQFLYQDKSILQQAALKSQAGINTAWNNKIVNVNVGGDVKFSNSQTDYGLTVGLDKLFIFKGIIEKGAIALDPSAYIYSGTHNYFQNVKGRSILGLPAGNASLQQANKFSVLAYEFSMPVVLVKGKFNVYVSPAYVMPQNLVTVSGRPDLTERGSDLFYFSAGAGIKL